MVNYLVINWKKLVSNFLHLILGIGIDMFIVKINIKKMSLTLKKEQVEIDEVHVKKELSEATYANDGTASGILEQKKEDAHELLEEKNNHPNFIDD